MNTEKKMTVDREVLAFKRAFGLLNEEEKQLLDQQAEELDMVDERSCMSY